MAATGVSDKWQTSKKNVLRILTTPTFDEFTAALACKEDIYALFTTWLAMEYDTSNGSSQEKTFLSPDVAVNYLRSLIHIGKAKFGEANDSARCFFNCLDAQATNPKALWLKGLIKNMHRSMCQRV
jgi:hypothetical protein